MKMWCNPVTMDHLKYDMQRQDSWSDDWYDWEDRNVYSCFASQSPLLALPAIIQTQIYDDMHWVISSSAEPGFITLLDEHAMQVLRQFQQPMTMIEALRRVGNGRALSVMRAVQHFVALGLLRHVQANEVQPGIVQEQNISVPLPDALRMEATRILQQGQLVAF